MNVAGKCPALRSLGGLIASLPMMASLSGYMAVEARASTPARTVFIVTCRCETVAARQRIAKVVRRQGGTIVYMYDTMPGLAVASPRGDDADRFMVRLRRIPDVTDVRVSGTHELQSTTGLTVGGRP